MPEQKNAQKKIAICFLAFSTLCEILLSMSYERGILAVQHYVGPVSFAFLGMMLLSGRVKLTLDECLSLCYPLWYLLSRLMLRELYIDDSFYSYTSLCLVYLMAFPFARWMNDGDHKTGLRTVAALFGGAHSVLAWIGIWTVVSRQTVVLPYVGTTFALEGGRLGMSGHANVTACIFVAAFVLLLWLMLTLRRRLVIIPCMIGLLGLYLAIGLTDSRTVMLQVSCAFAALAMFACQKLPVRQKTLKRLIPIAVAVVVLVVGYLSFDVAMEGLTAVSQRYNARAEEFITNRELGKDLLTMNARSDIYRAVFQLFRDHPDVLLRGVREREVVSLLHEYTNLPNTHNAWLQVVLSMGLPGLAIALWFTVRTVVLLIHIVFGDNDHIGFADQFLMSAPAVLLLNAIPESYVFTELKPDYNFVFFLLLGYALETWRRLQNGRVKA